MAKHLSSMRERIVSVLLSSVSPAPRTVPIRVGSYETWVDQIYSKCNSK
jgi:hypothetical protein